jgi:hypothetical protein
MALCLIKGYVFLVWFLIKHRDNFTFTLRVKLRTKDDILWEWHRVQTDSGIYIDTYLMGSGDFSPGVKRPVPEADH